MLHLTFRYRVKDKHAAQLNRMARAVNFVWNFCGDTQKTAVQRGDRWPSAFTVEKLTVGTSKTLGLRSGTIGAVCQQYARSLRQSHRSRLRYRGRRSLGWVPIRANACRALANGLRFGGTNYDVWMSRSIPDGGKIVDGSGFSADARGRWYLNLVVEMPEAQPRTSTRAIGVDLGLKALAATSDGEAIAAPQIYRKAEERLGKAQRAGRKRQARTIHAKIANQRRDFLHKASTDLVRRYDFIAVGNVSAASLGRTRLAKSVRDAGWSSFRNMLRYKAITHGARYVEVNERLTTQVCSECGSLGGPKGRENLGVREWTCVSCGVVHDRDINSARNILGLGHQAP